MVLFSISALKGKVENTHTHRHTHTHTHTFLRFSGMLLVLGSSLSFLHKVNVY